MKRLPKPDLDSREVYVSCVGGVSDESVIVRHQMSTEELLQLAQLYDARAFVNQLHLFPAAERGRNEQMVAGTLTKGDMVSLYSNHMVKRNQSARPYYDRLMLCAPLGKCPYCGFGHVSTLDHFMSKARYPSFSVLPFNLVPSCSDCNRGKGAEVLNEHNQIPHPYYEDALIENEKWLFALIEETAPASTRYFVAPPAKWPRLLAVRIENHFHSLDLASRFSVEAASEMISVSDYLTQLSSSELISEYLGKMAHTERQRSKNTWKAALYEALSESNWYCEGGWRPPIA